MDLGLDRIARRLAGPTVRRLRRERQWYACRRQLDLTVLDEPGARRAGLDHTVITHATPVVRRLAGVDLGLQRTKAVNLRLAVAHLDGVVLAPGQRLSFWHRVGPPSARRGYVEGVVLDDGRLTAGIGGGLCQLTNLLYWMTLHTPLTVVERWRHTYDVFPDVGRTQPFGTGATCAYPALDLQLENRTTQPFRLSVGVQGRGDEQQLVGAWFTDQPPRQRYEIYESAHLMTHDGPGVFRRHNSVRRRVIGPDGAQLDDEPVAENHALLRYQPFLPAAAPRPEAPGGRPPG